MKVIEPPNKVSDWTGKTVCSRFPVENGLGMMPAGTLFLIISSGVKKELASIPCECCGFSFKIYTKDSKERFLKRFEFVEIEDQSPHA